MEVEGLDATDHGAGGHYAWMSIDGTDYSNVSQYGLGPGEYAIGMSYQGVFWGRAICSSTPSPGQPDTSSKGQYCWCQLTGYTQAQNFTNWGGFTDDFSGGPECKISRAKWVFMGDFEDIDECEGLGCAEECSMAVAYWYPSFQVFLDSIGQ